jgi:hypothetical protein
LHREHRIFLLSPANLAGIRAGYVTSEKSKLELARRLREKGIPIGELFSFISGLYFRGKLAYAQAFAAAPPGLAGSFVITTSSGLLPTETIIDLQRMHEFAASDIHVDQHQYRVPLDRDCGVLAEKMGDRCSVVLLGSIATPKYAEPLLKVFGERLLFPAEFVGRGDMSRGGLMLRAVQEGRELAYVPVLNAPRHGPRPPKLAPLKPSRKSHQAASAFL